MSQYPYPPQQPPPQVPYGYGYYLNDPLNTLLAPAKRASVFMFVMCGFMIPCGLLFSLFAGILKGMDRSQLQPDQQAALAQAEQQFAGLGLSVHDILKCQLLRHMAKRLESNSRVFQNVDGFISFPCTQQIETLQKFGVRMSVLCL